MALLFCSHKCDPCRESMETCWVSAEGEIPELQLLVGDLAAVFLAALAGVNDDVAVVSVVLVAAGVGNRLCPPNFL